MDIHDIVELLCNPVEKLAGESFPREFKRKIYEAIDNARYANAPLPRIKKLPANGPR